MQLIESATLTRPLLLFAAIVADQADEPVQFNAASLPIGVPSSPMSSLVDQTTDLDPLDFTMYMDQVRKISYTTLNLPRFPR